MTITRSLFPKRSVASDRLNTCSDARISLENIRERMFFEINFGSPNHLRLKNHLQFQMGDSKNSLNFVMVQGLGEILIPPRWWGGGEMEENCPLCDGTGLWYGWNGRGYAAPCPCEQTPIRTRRGGTRSSCRPRVCKTIVTPAHLSK